MTPVFNLFIPGEFLSLYIHTHTCVHVDTYKYFILIQCDFFNVEFSIQHIWSTHANLLNLNFVLYWDLVPLHYAK